MTPKRLEIWWTDLDPTIGSETRKTRPVIVLSTDVLNERMQRIAIAPLLKGHKNFLFAVDIAPSKQNGLDQNRRIDMTQLRFIDKQRLRGRQGVLEADYQTAIQDAIKVVLALS